MGEGNNKKLRLRWKWGRRASGRPIMRLMDNFRHDMNKCGQIQDKMEEYAIIKSRNVNSVIHII